MPVSRRPRRRAGAKPESFASRRRRHAGEARERNQRRHLPGYSDQQRFSDLESPEDNRAFDEEFWREQRPPHWG